MPGHEDTEVRAGTVVAGCRVLGVAGRGGMGVVYRAQQIDLDRPVALKLIAHRLADDVAFRERFVREARATAAIDHPNVVPVYAAGEDQGRLYLAMRFVDGEDLRARVRGRGPLTPEEAARLTQQIGAALDAAHERGLVHRDVKPANVLLDGDHAYLTDFGLTKRAGGEPTMTGSGKWVGTLGYIAPEQIRSQPVDARTDVYALGCLLSFMLTGESPYRRDSDEATLYAHLHDPAPDLSAAAPGVPPALAAVVRRALEKDPGDRYQSAGDLGSAALAAVGAGPARPERVVARGAAAPGAGAADQTLLAGSTPTPTPDAPTLHAGGAAPPDAGLTARSRRAVTATVLGSVALVAVVTVIALGGGDDGTPAAPATGAGPRLLAGRPVAVDRRPNAIAAGFGRIWVGSAGERTVTALDERTSRKLRTFSVGGSVTGIATGFGALWVITGPNHQLLRVNPRTQRIVKRLTLPRSVAVSIATDSRYVWVGVRPPGEVVSSIFRIDPKTGERAQAEFGEEGIAGLATGGNRVFVPNRRRPRLSVLRPGTLERKSNEQIGGEPRGVAYGNGYAWATLEATDAIARLDRGLRDSRTFSTCDGPQGVAVSSAGVWIACRFSDELALLRPDREPSLLRVRVGANPYAVVAEGKQAWVTNLADGTVTPVRASGL